MDAIVTLAVSEGSIEEGCSSSDLKEPPTKRCKVEVSKKEKKLARRLENILCCVICLDLPSCAVYQCSNGHLMCAGCMTRLMADSKLRDEEAKCPTCRIEFSKQSPTRNLAVENALSEFPSQCRFCGKEYPRNMLTTHEANQCEVRKTPCKYNVIGCLWDGSYKDCAEHEKQCSYPELSGKELMETLIPLNQRYDEERKHLNTIFDLMSFDKYYLVELQLRPYYSDEYIHKLYYETNRFSAHFNQWVVKTQINASLPDASQCCERTLSYQLSLKTNTKQAAPIIVNYLAVRGPYGIMKLKPQVYRFEFNETQTDAPFVDFPLEDSAECNRLLALKVIHFRLIMFVVTK